ncbi:hypothetical protein ACIGXM_02905 [Kitasatospora sp. NPDC052896]|uniref:hypothetical protein n=1 Tax=Kitasatospora sp. NPDC052896 TaxID=3364061 RepID=UPI0037C57AAB
MTSEDFTGIDGIDGFRTALDDELLALTPPPLGDVVGAAAQRGRRIRRLRVISTAAASVVALATLTALLTGPLDPATRSRELGAAAGPSVVAGQPSPAPTPTPTPTPTPSDTPTASPSASQAGPVAAADATGAAVLQAVLNLLPKGVTPSHLAANDASVNGNEITETGAQVYLTSAAGTGMIRVDVGKGDGGDLCARGATCYRDSRGQQVSVLTLPGNCVQSLVVTVEHSDHSVVMISVASCLAWDGSANRPGVPALTADQATAIAGDPTLTAMMPAEYIARANALFGGVPTFS